jgi:hypothetical protein
MTTHVCTICGETYNPPDTRCGCGEPMDGPGDDDLWLMPEVIARREAALERDLTDAGRGHLNRRGW